MRALPGWIAVTLAAGQGTRMHSARAKVSHRLAGRPMIQYVLASVAEAGVPTAVVVLGHRAEDVQPLLPPGTRVAFQRTQLGTGHAALQAREVAGDAEHVLLLYGDVPLLRPTTLRALIDGYLESGATLGLLTALVDDPAGYGRVLRDVRGRVTGVVEERDATAEQRAVREMNCGIYCCRGDWLWRRLECLRPAANGELYLTQVVEQAAAEGGLWAYQAPDWMEGQGINDRQQLARAEAELRERVRRRWLEAGVTMLDPSTCFIDADVSIGQDTVIYPNTLIEGRSAIGAGCTLGPNTHIVDSVIGDDCRVWASYLEEARVGSRVRIGPMSHLRPGANLADEVNIGNYAEVKNARLGRGTQQHHFSYIGDAELGDEVNVGAGTITCNFSSETGRKSATRVGDGASLGSDTLLVAPVSVGRRAMTGAGAVVTRDVPDEVVVYGVPARPARTRRDQRREDDAHG